MAAKNCIYQEKIQELFDHFDFNLKALKPCIEPNGDCHDCKHWRLYSYLKKAQIDIRQIEFIANNQCKEK